MPSTRLLLGYCAVHACRSFGLYRAKAAIDLMDDKVKGKPLRNKQALTDAKEKVHMTMTSKALPRFGGSEK